MGATEEADAVEDTTEAADEGADDDAVEDAIKFVGGAEASKIWCAKLFFFTLRLYCFANEEEDDHPAAIQISDRDNPFALARDVEAPLVE